MPEFTHPFSGNNCERELYTDELIRAIRFSIASEFEAIQLYEQIEKSITNKLAKKILKDIAEEEKVHVGEFLKLLSVLDKEEAEFYDKGKREVEEKFIK